MHYTLTLPETLKPMTVQSLLMDEWLVPRKVRHFLRIRKNVQVNGETATFQTIVYPQDHVSLLFSPEDYSVPVIQLGNPALVTVLYEDEHLLIVNKPTGMKTHPNQPDEADTLLNHLAAYLAEQQLTPYVVHRLDKETSGAILFAKNPFVLPILGRMLEAKEIKRAYQAIVTGCLKEPSFTVQRKIGRDRHDRRKRCIDERNGQIAITHFTIAKTEQHRTHLWCHLETGRTHQIRVHLASLGHPIVGDPLYGKAGKRMLLHGARLSMIHPFSKKKLEISASPTLF